MWTSPELIHLGLAYIAGTLEQRGHAVRVFDAAAETQSYETILKQGWDVVGVTATTPQIFEAYEAIDSAKKLTGAITMMGGPHPTLEPMAQVERPTIDLVVRGEAEAPLNELFEILEKLDGKPFSSVRDQLSEVGSLTIKLETGET